MAAPLQATLNERAQITFNVAGFASVYPSLASASWRMQIRPFQGSPTLLFDFAASGTITYIPSPLPMVIFQAPTSALADIPSGAAAYEYGFVLPGADYEVAGWGEVIFYAGVVEAGVVGTPAAPTGSDDTWYGGANPTPNPVPPTLTSVIALVTQAVAAAQAAAAASGSGSAIAAAASAASALASAATATSEAAFAAAQVALAQAQVALATAQASAAATSATAAAGSATSAAAQVTLAAAQVALATAQAAAAAASASTATTQATAAAASAAAAAASAAAIGTITAQIKAWFATLPTSSTGLPAGTPYNNGNTLGFA